MELTALLMGFVGSLHCVTMCSPLSVAATNLTQQAFLNKLLYNSGRILMYAILGSIFGFAGALIQLASFQYIVIISMGLALLLFGFVGISSVKIPFVTYAVIRLTTMIKSRFGNLFLKRTRSSIFMLGMLNGILPCGLSLMALGYTVVLKGPIDGFLFMFLFGVGTLPAMLGGASVIHSMFSNLRLGQKALNSGLLILSGGLILARVFVSISAQAHETGERLVDIVFCR
jgi:uncharacterized protein